MSDVSTRLSGVNYALRLLGHSPVNALGAGKGAEVIEARIDAASRELQDRPMWFMRERYTPTLSARGYAHLPDIYELPPDGNRSHRIDVREGRRIFDVSNQTYVWAAAPVNLVTDPFDLTTGSWTPASLTAADGTGFQPPVEDDPLRRVTSLTESGQNASIAQTIAAAGFTDGQEYVISLYYAMSPASARTQGAFSLRLNAVSVVDQAILNLNFTEAEETKEWGYAGTTFNGYGAEQVRVQRRTDTGLTPPGWHLVTFRRTYATAFGDMTLSVHPDTDTADTDLVIGIAGGVRVSTPGDFPLGAIDVLRRRSYEEMPEVAQLHVLRRAAVDASHVLGSSDATRRRLVQKEEESWAAVNDMNRSRGRHSMLTDSPGVQATLGRINSRTALRRRLRNHHLA
jgi:hypothetical protein